MTDVMSAFGQIYSNFLIVVQSDYYALAYRMLELFCLEKEEKMGR